MSSRGPISSYHLLSPPDLPSVFCPTSLGIMIWEKDGNALERTVLAPFPLPRSVHK